MGREDVNTISLPKPWVGTGCYDAAGNYIELKTKQNKKRNLPLEVSVQAFENRLGDVTDIFVTIDRQKLRQGRIDPFILKSIPAIFTGSLGKVNLPKESEKVKLDVGANHYSRSMDGETQSGTFTIPFELTSNPTSIKCLAYDSDPTWTNQIVEPKE